MLCHNKYCKLCTKMIAGTCLCGCGRFWQQHLSVISAGGAAQHTTVRPTLRCPEHCKQVVLSACQKDHLPAHFSSAAPYFGNCASPVTAENISCICANWRATSGLFARGTRTPGPPVHCSCKKIFPCKTSVQTILSKLHLAPGTRLTSTHR